MIKLLSTTICLISIALITPAYAKMKDYKCFITSVKKGGQVVFYRWEESQLPIRVAGLPGKQLTDAKGKKYFIKEVEECVPLSDSFTSDKENAVDKRTLRQYFGIGVPAIRDFKLAAISIGTIRDEATATYCYTLRFACLAIWAIDNRTAGR